MRVLAIGDIHGCFTALETLAGFVPFGDKDRIVTLGDYVNRGPDTRSVIEWMLANHATRDLIPLRGNHELMMSAARRSSRHYDEWLQCGGQATLDSYAPFGTASVDDIPKAHWKFLDEACRPYFETKSHFFVHANVYPDCSLEEQPDYMLFWEHYRGGRPHESGKIMVCGHTPQHDGIPKDYGHAICIDTAAHAGGWLTCLDVTSRKYWQANEKRETRTGRLF
ncbi:MAG: serine/threonine protein phosphatase [Planctomycetaceae bacterium]|nr:serine/threonine protein phosphatase [Planctomycetaceae bacterium]